MAYEYQQERPRLFSEEGQVAFLKIRDQVQRRLKESGAFRVDKLEMLGDSWLNLACLDRLVELKEIVPLRADGTCWGQYQVYTSPETHNY